MATLTDAIAYFFGIQHATVQLYYDNNEALRYHPLSRATYTKLTKRDIDLKLKMNHLITNSHITDEFKEIDGHTDDENEFDYNKSDQPTRRNIDMDAHSKAFLTSIYRNNTHQKPIMPPPTKNNSIPSRSPHHQRHLLSSLPTPL